MSRVLQSSYLLVLFFLAIIIILGWKSILLSESLLNSIQVNEIQPAPSSAPAPEADKLLAQAVLVKTARDPFRWPSEQPSEGISRPMEIIKLKAVLIDPNGSLTKISVNEQVSPWLAAGDEFKYWRVTAITDSSVIVTRHGQSKTMLFRR